MLIKDIVLCFIGISGGFVVGGGVFAFITMIGIFPRLADRTNTACYLRWYEAAIIIGGTLGNVFLLFQWKIPLGVPFLIFFGWFSGIYVGCLAMALAESLKVIPVFLQRSKLRYGIAWIILGIAIGKGIGTLFQFW
ncbi:MAG: stage sporulation protein [Clostridiales bacterium]|nr:stage sporulation protein [Clostridiales bacterium]